jgi:SHS2 domain-containing protein
MSDSEPTWGYFQHDADIGVIGRGATIERSFEAAAMATFAVMLDPATVGGEQTLTVEFDEPDPEIALLRWLNGLLAESRIERLALVRFQLVRDGDHWHGTAWGDRWRDDSERGTEVKGATFTTLRVRQINSAWESRCVIDV